MSIIVTVKADAAIAFLGDAARRITPDRFMKNVGQRLLAWTNQNFREEGAEAKWTPLSPNTLAARRKGRGSGGARILRDTGRMAQSFVLRVGHNEVEVGTADRKAVWHQGGTRPRTVTAKVPGKPMRFRTASGWRSKYEVHHPGMPARPLLPSERLAARLVMDVAQAFINRELGGTLAAK